MSSPRVISVEPGSPAATAGLAVGDELWSIEGEQPRDILEYRTLTDGESIAFEIIRDGLMLDLEVEKPSDQPLGIEVHSALFDEVRTCDNHCEFCFIYQLPPGLRKSLYLKDDDYRLSFLYGNYTTLTRFTEADFERVVTEKLSPLNVSIHATEPAVREEMLRNRRGASSLRRLVHAADEYYIAAGRPFPPHEHYGDTPMHEDGIGMARTFEAEFTGLVDEGIGTEAGFFSWVDAAPAEGYRAPRTCGDEGGGSLVQLKPRANAPVGILTGSLGAAVLAPLIDDLDRDDVRVIPVDNEFFGGNVGVAGLLVGEDLARVLAAEPEGHRYLLPDVCLNRGVFLDGMSPDDLPRPVEILPTDGVALRAALEPK